MLDDLAAGRADALLALDLDRACRDPRDLEDLIDVVEARVPRIPVESVTGSLRLANDADVTQARVMVAMGNKSSRDTARRVSDARERQALAGQYGGGKRPYGFESDGKTVRPTEADHIADAAHRLLQGVPLRSLALELRRNKVPTVTGAAWSSQTLRDILMRPRNAAIMIHRGEEVGPAPWDAIVTVDVFRAVVRLLQNPDRRLGPGSAPRWLGSGLYRCGICTSTVVGLQVGTAGGQPVYRCPAKSHLGRAVRHVDGFVVAVIVQRLARPDAVDLLSEAAPDVDVAALRAEAKALRRNLNEMAADRAAGLIDREQMLAGTRRNKGRLDAIDQVLAPAIVESPLKPLIGVDDVESAWNALPLGSQRAVLDKLMTVTVLPSGRSGRGFNPATVEICWKTKT